jgi:hypothetical protein
VARFLDEMRPKLRLDSKNLDIAIARPITGYEYRRGIETLCANSNSQFVQADLILESCGTRSLQ